MATARVGGLNMEGSMLDLTTLWAFVHPILVSESTGSDGPNGTGDGDFADGTGDGQGWGETFEGMYGEGAGYDFGALENGDGVGDGLGDATGDGPW